MMELLLFTHAVSTPTADNDDVEVMILIEKILYCESFCNSNNIDSDGNVYVATMHEYTLFVLLLLLMIMMWK